MIQLTRTGVVFSGTEDDLARQRAQFDRDHYIILPKLFDSELLQMVLKRIESARFVPFDHKGVALEYCMDDPPTIQLLEFVANVPSFRRLVERITGCGGIGVYRGRVYRMTSSDGHQTIWHDDWIQGRMITMSVNLTPHIFHGGALEMRNRGTKTILHEIHNTGLGDALLFRIGPDLQHRVQPIEGSIPKTALAGWFTTGKNFFQTVRELRTGSVSSDPLGRPVRERSASGLSE
jgi:hypothetical protein